MLMTNAPGTGGTSVQAPSGATICRPLPPYLRCISFIHGNDCLQGPHHEAQKSTYTTLPFRSDSFCATALPGRSTSGAGCPRSAAKPLAWPRRTATATAARVLKVRREFMGR